MKKISKIRLKNVAHFLTNKEMKNISGGYIYDRRWRCSCYRGTNPPFKSPWESYYHTNQAKLDDIRKICSGGEGTCIAIGY